MRKEELGKHIAALREQAGLKQNELARFSIRDRPLAAFNPGENSRTPLEFPICVLTLADSGVSITFKIGQKKALAIAVRNDRPQRRYSGLLCTLQG
jgi:hypothetical protein